MKKKILLLFIFSIKTVFSFSGSSVFAQSPDIPFWYMDVTIDNSLLGTPSQQRA